MALETNIVEFPFTTGQNEGTERAVLPMGQFSYLQNARYRKNQRLGKRNGYTSKSSLDASGNPLGNGNGRLACLGPEFCVVDDRFYQRDTTTDTWALPPSTLSNGPVGGTRLPGRFPQFMPAATIETINVQGDVDLGGITGTARDSTGGMTYGLGHIWTCATYYIKTAGNGWCVRVAATDPSTGKVTMQKDLPFNSGAVGDRPCVQLLATGNGNTIVLVCDDFTAGVKTGVSVRTLTSITAGWNPEVFFTCIQHAANYDPSAPGGILFVYALTGSPATYTIARMNPTTMVATASGSLVPGGNKTSLSCFGNSAGLVWVGVEDSVNGLQSHAWNAALVIQGTGFNWRTVLVDAIGPIMFATRTATSVAAVARSNVTPSRLNVYDVTSAAAKGVPMRQFDAQALSQPFTIGSQVFIWARHTAGAQLGVATLLRIPLASEYPNGLDPFIRAFPLEATLDDRDVDDPLAPDTSGPMLSTPMLTPLGYTAHINYTRTSLISGGAARLFRGFVLVPVRHRSDGVRYSSSCVVSCSGKQFIAAAQPMWADALGEYEAGFVQSPMSNIATVSSAGGNLTANSTYFHTVVFESIDANGLVERSAPAIPAKGLTTGNQTLTVNFTTMQFGMRSVRGKVHRTVANGSVFYLVGTINATPASDAQGYFTFIDTYADSDIIQNEALYINIGQELPASNFPACSFANVGGNRLWCGGGFTGNVVTASKQFAPHLVPEFPDDDAFRVVLPADCTGAAWCDAEVLFTQEGIYIVGGDGPDVAGVGFFTLSRLPFNIGCIDWRSVAVTDLGVFFQSARGLYLLPRGFGAPVAMDQTLDTLTTYPIITSARADYNSRGGADNSEQIVQWTAVADEAATSGVTITFDLAYKSFYVDTCSADYPATFASGWSGDAVQAPALLTQGPNGATKWHPFRVRDASFDDEGLSIDMRGFTGDIRPWGTFAHGVVNRAGLLGELRAACELEVKLTTDCGESHWKSRIYDLIAGDAQSGDVIYLEAPLGQPEQRDIVSLRVGFHEHSTTEGAALFGLYIEHQKQNQGWRLQAPRNRVNVLANALITESGADVITTEDGEQIVTES